MTQTIEPPTQTTVKIGQAKGRPMLSWVGKRPLRDIAAFPAQEVERFAVPEAGGLLAAGMEWSDWPERYSRGGLLFHGDNKEVLAHLLANGFRGKVDLVYIDPPFDSGADYVRRVQLRGVGGTARLDGEGYTLGEQIQYTDIWANDNYLQFMYERLLLLKELLTEGGSFWLHCDVRRSHMLRLVLDEVFGVDAFRNEIIWQRTASRNDAKEFGHVHDTLFYYVKGGVPRIWNPVHTAFTEEYVNRYYNQTDENGRRYAVDNLTAPGLRSGSSGKSWRGFDLASMGLHWKYTTEKLDQLDAQGRIYWPRGGAGFPRYKRYLDELSGKMVTSIWTDVFVVNSQADEREDYPTQKPESLLERIIRASSNSGSIVLDCFIGSGTTAAVAQKLGRRWIGCDINKGAIQITTKRLIDDMREQAEAKNGQAALPETDTPPKPAQLSFTTYRVNDYDLAIQRNEAVNLACEHIGVVRTRTESFFDGTLGKELVKIIRFDHPASRADLEEIAQEIRNRPDEDRDIVAVCLGKELACDAWLTEHNRKGAPNKIRLIELRTDPKYGQFIAHEGASATASVRREDGRLKVVVEEFVSPTIVARLKQQSGIVAPHITDWRSMVDSVMIDPAYDGQVFKVALADVPEQKMDLVRGTYELPAPEGPSTVAVKITDMLGEEVLVVRSLE